MRYLILLICVVAMQVTTLAKVGAHGEDNDTVALKEVVVQSSQPITKLEGDGFLTRIAGTNLAKLGMAKDVLGFMPGVIVTNGNVEVVGRGAPTFYINGRKMRNKAELDQLRSDKIKDITVINNPGARYSGEIASVIRITTVKEVGDGFALDNKATLGVSNYLYGKDQLWMNYRSGKVDVFSTLEYDYKRTKNRSEAVQHAWTSPQITSQISKTDKTRSSLYEGQVGFNAQLDDKNELGAYYQIDYKPMNAKGYADNSILFDEASGTMTHSDSYLRDRYTNHSIEGYFNGDWGKWWFEANISALWRMDNRHEEILETELHGANVHKDLYSNKNRGRMLAADVDVSRTFGNGGRLDFGASYSNSNRKDDFVSDGNDMIQNENNRICENIITVYVDAMHKIGQARLQAGIRYEHINSDYYEFGHKISDQSRKYDEFLPSVSLGLPFGKQMVLQLKYSRKYRRPLYSQLSATTKYVNPYLYESGNPLLKSSYSDNVSVDFKWKWLVMQALYKRVSKQIITEAVAYPAAPEITLLRKANADRALHQYQLVASIMPGFIAKKWYPVFMAGLVGQSFKVDYRDNTINMNTPIWIVRFNNMIVLPEGVMLSLNASWKSHGDSENITMRSTWQTDLSVTKKINYHWDLKLTANDIFNTARKTRFTFLNTKYSLYNEKISTARFVELTVGYKFNVTKSKYKGTGAAKSEKERF